MISIVIAAAVALLGTLIGTPLAIRVLVRKGYGQLIRDDGPTTHHVKRGTPTMGGIVIVLAVIAAYTAAHLITWTPPRASGVLVLFLTAGLGLVGFLDDWIKVSKQRSLGLRSGAKLAGQVAIGLAFAVLSFQFPNDRSGPAQYEALGGITPASPAISLLRDVPFLVLPVGLAVVWILLLIAASSNGMNLTDGVDGLAAGASVMVFGAYTLVNIWQYNQSCSNVLVAGPTCYEVRDPHDLAVIAVAIAGACFGFLWWNCQPAKIFMGDTGSLALGGAMAAMAIYTRTELLLLLIGGLFVVNTLSVILQVGWFRITGGKRLFPMAPLHHTFELKGWAESTVVIRFWIIAGIFVAVGLALFYAEWVSGL